MLHGVPPERHGKLRSCCDRESAAERNSRSLNANTYNKSMPIRNCGAALRTSNGGNTNCATRDCPGKASTAPISVPRVHATSDVVNSNAMVHGNAEAMTSEVRLG